MEILVPHHPSVEGITKMREQYPGVHFVEMSDLKTYTGRQGSREDHDELRARGMCLTRGRLIALTEDHGVLAAEWTAHFAQAQGEPCAAVGWERFYGAMRARLADAAWRLFWCVFALGLPASILARMTISAWRKRRTMLPFLRALLFTTALVMSWSYGQLVGYWPGRANALGAKVADAVRRRLRMSP
jgi:hypothetical protein